MMVVVVDNRNPLWIKGVSLQHRYNQGLLTYLCQTNDTWLYPSCNDNALQDKAFSPVTTTTLTLKIAQQ